MSRSMSHNCQFALFEIKPHRVMQGTCFCYNLEKSEKKCANLQCNYDLVDST